MNSALELVHKQAEDEGLWFQAMTAPEEYLQDALRKLHAAVERDEAIKNQGEPVGWQQVTHANAPKYGERVIVLTTDADGDPIPEFAHYNGELGFLGIGGKRIKPVSYWMPSPAAPKGEQP